MNIEEIKEIRDTHNKLMDHGENFDLILQVFEKCITISDSPVLEIGTNMGGSSKCFLNVLSANNKKNYFVGVDPYGSILYHNGGFIMKDSPYPNGKYHSAMKEINSFVGEKELDYVHFKVTSKEFCDIIYPSIGIHNNGQTNKFNKFSFIFLDGSHDPEVVHQEMEFFQDKIETGCSMIVDDWDPAQHGHFIGEFLNRSKLTVGVTTHQRLVLDRING